MGGHRRDGTSDPLGDATSLMLLALPQSGVAWVLLRIGETAPGEGWRLKGRAMPVKSADSYLRQVLPALDDTADRFVALVSSASDTTIRIPACPGWTVRDLAAHMADTTVQYGRAAWSPAAATAARPDAKQLVAQGAASAEELAARLHPELAALRACIDAQDGQMPEFRYNDGPLVPADAGLGILLGELEVHGHDLARALGRPWLIDPGHAALTVEGISPILPAQVRPDRAKGLTASFEIRLRGFASHIWEFRDGQLHVNPPHPGQIDVHLSADPAALLLVMYRRESQWKHISAGRLVAWGHKPWLAFTLVSRFHRP